MEPHRPLSDDAVERSLSADASRRIIATCIRKAASAKAISEDTGLPLASTYRQVKRLVADGLLVVERSAMTADGKPYDLYRSRIRLGRIEVDPRGVHVSWEANAAVEDRLATLWNRLGD